MKWEKIMKTKLETPESVTPRARTACSQAASRLGCVQVEANFKYSMLGQEFIQCKTPVVPGGGGGLVLRV